MRWDLDCDLRWRVVKSGSESMNFHTCTELLNFSQLMTVISGSCIELYSD